MFMTLFSVEMLRLWFFYKNVDMYLDFLATLSARTGVFARCQQEEHLANLILVTLTLTKRLRILSLSQLVQSFNYL